MDLFSFPTVGTDYFFRQEKEAGLFFPDAGDGGLVFI